MLHKIKLLEGSDRLEHVVEFQRKLLAYACDAATPLPFDEKHLRAAFPTEGDWLWGKLKPVKRKSGKAAETKFGKALLKIIKYCQNHPTMGKRVLDAFDNDTKFDKKIGDATFRFQYPDLSGRTRRVIIGLMKAFYNDLLATGFPEAVHGAVGENKFDRRKLIDAFLNANDDFRLCPACDGPRSTMLGGEVKADVDHFLPKSKYPFLSVHPLNLVPLCLDCNRTVKGDRDPIDQPEVEPLTNCFHPYYIPARDLITVSIQKDASGKLSLQIQDKMNHPSRRVRGLNNAFRLEERWPDKLEDAKKRLIENVLDSRKQVVRYGRIPDDKELRSSLNDLLESRTGRIGEDYWYILHASYVNYVIANKDEFDRMLIMFSKP